MTFLNWATPNRELKKRPLCYAEGAEKHQGGRASCNTMPPSSARTACTSSARPRASSALVRVYAVGALAHHAKRHREHPRAPLKGGLTVTASPYIAVVGGVNIDIGGRSDAPLVAGDSNPGASARASAAWAATSPTTSPCSAQRSSSSPRSARTTARSASRRPVPTSAST